MRLASGISSVLGTVLLCLAPLFTQAQNVDELRAAHQRCLAGWAKLQADYDRLHTDSNIRDQSNRCAEYRQRSDKDQKDLQSVEYQIKDVGKECAAYKGEYEQAFSDWLNSFRKNGWAPPSGPPPTSLLMLYEKYLRCESDVENERETLEQERSRLEPQYQRNAADAQRCEQTLQGILALPGKLKSIAESCSELERQMANANANTQGATTRPPAPPVGATVRPFVPPPTTSPPPGPRPAIPDGSQSGWELPTIPEGKLTNIWVYCDPKRIPLHTKATCKAYGGIQFGRPYPPDISTRVNWTNEGPFNQPGLQTVTAHVEWITGSDTVWVEDAAGPQTPSTPANPPPPLRPPKPPGSPDTISGPVRTRDDISGPLRQPDTVSGPTKPASADCWRRKPARIETTYDKVWGGKPKSHSFAYSETSAALTVKTPDNKSYSNTVNWKAPPDTICKGQDVALSIQSSRSDGALITGDVRHNGAGPTPQVSSWNMLAASAQATVKFTTKPSIFASAGSWVGTGFINDTHVIVRWEYE